LSGHVYGEVKGRVAHVHHDDSGGASRFFYCAKASSAERDAWGLLTLDARKRDDGRKAGKPGGDNPRNRGVHERRNFHPTVKPVNLMRWLVRLITPPGGTVLDPFVGSGTTAIACEVEGFDWVGIEKDAEYAEIARQRIVAGWSEDGSHAENANPNQADLFHD
jgi:site-specific DNA-methyltransferase (adenine-specific)